MPNKWIEHIRAVSKEHNISYACAISIASKTYQKMSKDDKKEKQKKEMEAVYKRASIGLNKRIQSMSDAEIPLVKSIFYRWSKELKKYFIENYKSSFEKLLNTTEQQQIKQELKMK